MTPSFSDFQARKEKLAVVGLGYVGLPLAVALARSFSVIGFDVSSERVAELRQGRDRTGEVADAKLKACGVFFSDDPAVLREAAVVIAAVPTPIDEYRRPDLTPVEKASATIGANLRHGAVVVYESTVYPGVTEEVCVPILEKASGLRFGVDFTAGYSPERINPGDKVHTVDKIVKVVAGSDAPTLDLLAALYGAAVSAGIHKASCIRVAEAAKVIENTQRDLNIALMNELALIFDLLGLDTLEVLEAAGTKWNFLPFRPGLVGGHCIGVDPYYLTFKAESLGYRPEVILSGRRINDGMGRHVAEKCVKMLAKSGGGIQGAKVGILGLSFKEDVPDIRNTRVVDIAAELKEYGITPFVCDPLASSAEAEHEYGISLSDFSDLRDVDALIAAVPHAEYKEMPLTLLKSRFRQDRVPVLVDVKGIWSPEAARAEGFSYYRL